jgi:hypothetical protein
VGEATVMGGRERPCRGWPWLEDLLSGVGLVMLALIPRLLSLRAFVTADEAKWIKRSADFLLALMQGNFAGTCVNPTPGVTTTWTGALGLTLYALGQGVSSPGGLLAFLRGIPPFRVDLGILQAVRWPTGVITALGVGAAYWLARPLLGRWGALAGALLLALDPLYLAHSRIIHHDALATAFHTVALLSLLLYLCWRVPVEQEGPSHPWPLLVLSGASMGLAFLTKPTTLLLVPAAGLALLLTAWRRARPGARWRDGLGWTTRTFLLWIGVAYITVFLLWPAVWLRPIAQPRDVVANAFQSATPDSEEEEVTAADSVTPQLGVLYYPVHWLFKTTPPVMAGLVATLWWLVRKGKARKERGDSRSPEPPVPQPAVLISGLLLYALLLAVLMTLSDKRSVRYLLPAVVILDLVAGWGLAWLADALAAWPGLKGLGKLWSVLGAGLLLLLQGAFSLPYHPYYLTYYNPLVAGPWLAPRLIQIGWGEGLDKAGRYLSGLPGASRLRAVAGYTSAFAPFFSGRAAGLEEGRVDYVVLYIRQVQGGSPYPEFARYFQSQIAERVIRLAGVDYAWIYPGPSLFQVKGGSFPGGPTLVACRLDKLPVAAGEPAKLTLIWRGLEPAGPRYSLNVRLADESGRLWGDGSPHPISLAGDPPQSVYILEVPEEVPRGQGRLLATLYDEGGAALGQVDMAEVELRRFQLPRIAHPLDVNMGGLVRLRGYNANAPGPGQRAQAGDVLKITLYWQALGPTEAPYTVFVHLIDAEGRIWGQRDSQPGGGAWPTTEWTAGEVLADVYEVTIASETPPGTYRLEVGMYDPINAARLPVLDEAGRAVDDRVLVEERVTVWR